MARVGKILTNYHQIFNFSASCLTSIAQQVWIFAGNSDKFRFMELSREVYKTLPLWESYEIPEKKCVSKKRFFQAKNWIASIQQQEKRLEICHIMQGEKNILKSAYLFKARRVFSHFSGVPPPRRAISMSTQSGQTRKRVSAQASNLGKFSPSYNSN